MKKTIILLIATITILSTFSCEDENNPADSSNDIKEITMNHFGIDWSKGQTGDQITNYEDTDGETIAWCPTGNGGGWMQGVWYRAASGKVYKINTSDFSTISIIDTNLWAADLCSTPLSPGSIWAAKANDGFVIFKVLTVPTDSIAISADPLWSAKVQYKFSSTINF